MPGIVRGTPAPPPSRTGPTNQYGQPLTEYEQQQQKTQAGNTNLDRGAQNFYSGANRGVNYDMSYTDPRTGLSMNYKAQPTFGAQMSNFSQFMNKFGNLGGSGSSTSSGRGGLSGADQPRVQLDTNAIAEGDNAAFSRAKDRTGASMQGLMKSLQNQFAGRGLRGSSIEGRAIASGAESGLGQLADTDREQAIEGSRRAVDLAKTQYGGDIEQRGQDLEAEASQRSWESQAQNSKLNSILGLYNAFNGMRY
jgi:hypothetical protein